MVSTRLALTMCSASDGSCSDEIRQTGQVRSSGLKFANFDVRTTRKVSVVKRAERSHVGHGNHHGIYRLVEARRKLLQSTTSVEHQLRSMISRAMDSDRQLERQYWLDSAADLIGDQPPEQHGALVRSASRRIHACFSVAYDNRLAAVRLLSRKVVPVE